MHLFGLRKYQTNIILLSSHERRLQNVYKTLVGQRLLSAASMLYWFKQLKYASDA